LKRRKPSQCEKCGSDRVASVMYGLVYPTEALESDLEAGRVVLGGCSILPGSPEWRCMACHHEWGDMHKAFEEIKRRVRLGGGSFGKNESTNT
jgi:hypothetical protein